MAAADYRLLTDATGQRMATALEGMSVDRAAKTDLTSIIATGTTNTTGATIAAGTYFYLNGALVQALTNISSRATFTSGTNYEAVTAGGLNALNSNISKQDISSTVSSISSKLNKLVLTKSANCYNLYLQTKNNQSFSSGESVGAIPSAYKPSNNVIAIIATSSPTLEKDCLCWIGTDGVITLYGTIPSNTVLIINTLWIK